MSDLNISDFQYPPRGFVFPPSACNATWQGILTAKPLDLSYPPADPLEGQLLFIAGMICRFSEDATVSDLAWHVYSKLTAFGYRPSLGFGIFALVIFSVSCTWHGWQLFRTRAWVMVPVIIGVGLEIYGWTNRELANSNPAFYYVPQLAVLTIAPTFFSCTIYSLFQIMVQYIDPTAFFGINAKKAMWTWIAIDFCTLVIQATGGGLAATAGADQNLFTIGSHVMLAGIVLQLAVAIIFSVVALLYFKRIYRRAFDGHGHAGPDISVRIRDPVGRFAWGLGVIQGCIIARGFYRIAELAGGIYSSVARDQAALIALDALPMMITVVGLNIIHPQFVLPKAWWKGSQASLARGALEMRERADSDTLEGKISA